VSSIQGGIEARGAQVVEHLAHMLMAARLQHELDLHVLRGQRAECPLVVDFVDVGAGFGSPLP
jgi:hypothetical protein